MTDGGPRGLNRFSYRCGSVARAHARHLSHDEKASILPEHDEVGSRQDFKEIGVTGCGGVVRTVSKKITLVSKRITGGT
jgi:hypothetical protein